MGLWKQRWVFPRRSTNIVKPNLFSYNGNGRWSLLYDEWLLATHQFRGMSIKESLLFDLSWWKIYFAELSSAWFTRSIIPIYQLITIRCLWIFNYTQHFAQIQYFIMCYKKIFNGSWCALIKFLKSFLNFLCIEIFKLFFNAVLMHQSPKIYFSCQPKCHFWYKQVHKQNM